MSNGVMLVYELRRMGDSVLSLPFLRGARSAWDVRVICRPQSASLFEAAIDPRCVHPLPAPWADARDFRSTIGMARQLAVESRKLKPDVAVCAWADARVHAFMASSGAWKRVGFPMCVGNVLASNQQRRRGQIVAGRALDVLCRLAFLRSPLNCRLKRADRDQHHMEDWRQIGSVTGVTPDSSVPWFSFAPELSESARAVRDRLLAAKKNGRRRWLIHPGAGDAFKRWPACRFAQVADLIAGGNAEVLVVSPPDCPFALRDRSRAVVWAPDSLPAFAAMMSEVDFVLANDSLAVHLASALGKRTVAVFGPGNPKWFGPLTPGSEVARHPACERWPCLMACERDCCACLDGLEPATVMESVRKVEEWSGS